jgi:hypothetical protein
MRQQLAGAQVLPHRGQHRVSRLANSSNRTVHIGGHVIFDAKSGFLRHVGEFFGRESEVCVIAQILASSAGGQHVASRVGTNQPEQPLTLPRSRSWCFARCENRSHRGQRLTGNSKRDFKPKAITFLVSSFYSARKARMGSIEAARRAGINPAATAHSVSTTAAPISPTGSYHFTS